MKATITYEEAIKTAGYLENEMNRYMYQQRYDLAQYELKRVDGAISLISLTFIDVDIVEDSIAWDEEYLKIKNDIHRAAQSYKDLFNWEK